MDIPSISISPIESVQTSVNNSNLGLDSETCRKLNNNNNNNNLFNNNYSI